MSRLAVVLLAALATPCALLLPAASLPGVARTPLLLTAIPAAVVQGGTVEVRVRGAPTGAELRAGAQAVPLHRFQGTLRAFVGTSPLTPPGRLPLTVQAPTPDGLLRAATSVVVRRGDFGLRRLRVPPQLLDPALVARERARMAAATAHPLPEPQWTGPFIRPVDGAVTSGYGVRSIYNGVPRGYHLGVDFRGAVGTPVRAAHHGRVTLAEALPLSGHTVVLDHGAGIFTTYQHLDRIAVSPGQRVRQGAVVGTVGATGLVTGPHLHWGMRVHGVRVDPLFWTRSP